MPALGRRAEVVGPQVGHQLVVKGIAMAITVLLILIYIAMRSAGNSA
jgi:preprotein translocase subunit SecF